MKIEPIEYLVTFEDGKLFAISRSPFHNWKILSIHIELNFKNFNTFEEALEALKKWKEMKDG